jgi:transcriptional regulator with XRE-family HTH domain
MRTPKARALGKALRKVREERGYGLREFSKVLERDPGVLSRWETGERIPTPDQVAQYLTRLEVIGDPYEEIMELTRATDEPRWLAISLPEQRQQFDALLDFEQRATTITDVAPLLVPGLLQTNEYIRSIMTAGEVPDREFSRRTAMRIGRKDVLTRREPKPVQLATFIGEGALRQLIGSRAVMAEQLGHLRDAMTWPNVDLQVIPFDSGWHPALEGSCLVIDSDESEPVVHLNLRDSVLFLHEEDDVNRYRQAVEKVRRVALDPQDSAEVIAAYIQRWENVE